MKYKKDDLVRAKDLPKGTVITFSGDGYEDQRYEILRHDWFRYTDISTGNVREGTGVICFYSDNVIIDYPHGYQSPLWKVLNGEEVE